MAVLRKKLSKDTEIHRADNIRVMQVCTSVTNVQSAFDTIFVLPGECVFAERDQCLAF